MLGRGELCLGEGRELFRSGICVGERELCWREVTVLMRGNCVDETKLCRGERRELLRIGNCVGES